MHVYLSRLNQSRDKSELGISRVKLKINLNRFY